MKVLLSVDKNNRMTLIKSPICMIPYLFQKHYAMELTMQTSQKQESIFQFPQYDNLKITYTWSISYAPSDKLLHKAARYYIKHDTRVSEQLMKLAFTALCVVISEINTENSLGLINVSFINAEVNKKLSKTAVEVSGWNAIFACDIH